MSSKRNRKWSGQLQVSDLHTMMEVPKRCFKSQEKTHLTETWEVLKLPYSKWVLKDDQELARKKDLGYEWGVWSENVVLFSSDLSALYVST